jgi:hypothetical protein
MGQYLAIGLVTRFSASKKELQKKNLSKEELMTAFSNKFDVENSLYDLLEESDAFLFSLKKDVFATQLIPFLEKFYPSLYPNPNDYEDTLKELKDSASDTWLEMAEERGSEPFQLDNYAESEYLHFGKGFNTHISVGVTAIILSLEGKISMETYGTQFRFFKHCIQKTFSEFLLAKAIKVYITG